MAQAQTSDLSEIIGKYGEVAKVVNQREMKRFIEEVRQRWNPDPPEDSDPHGEGYTDEGAFALCVYQMAFLEPRAEVEREGPLCEAEERNQVLLHPPLESFTDEIEGPLFPPLPESRRIEILRSLETALQQQHPHVKLPEDFDNLMRLTNGLGLAGVRSETGHTLLVYGLGETYARRAQREDLNRMSGYSRLRGLTALAAWNIGGNDYRETFYTLFRDEAEATTSWKIFDKTDIEIDLYDSLLEFVQHETDYVEKTPGGARRDIVVGLYDKLPL